jgi:multidrug efflux pump subunit AcrA (membrane-fusion protein)
MELQNPGYVLRGGMLVAVTVTKARAVGAIVVPRSAVAQTPQGDMVYVVSDNKAQAVPVKVGVQTDTMAQVSSPRIQPGTMVVTTRPDALKDGSLVAVNNASSGTSSNGAVH